MSPVATASSPLPLEEVATPASKLPLVSSRRASCGVGQQVAPALAQDISHRRPSPWHDLAHSLSTTALPHRRSSGSLTGSTPPHTSSPGLSTSQALREWEARLAVPWPSVSRHALVPPHSPSTAGPSSTGSPASAPTLVPKLVPERDKEGHIEYKLKLIDPTPDRFDRLVTQMMWRLKQGRNEAIYEIGLADDGTVVGLSRADMDASLRTLELMASEVGATVIVLKEIILTGPTFPQRGSVRNDSPAGWVLPSVSPWQTPPEPEEQQAKKVKAKHKRKIWSRARRRTFAREGHWKDEPEVNVEKQIVFDVPDEGDESESEEDIVLGDRDDRPSTRRPRQLSEVSTRSDDDVPPFDLELGDESPPPALTAKARKALLRREARRYDLLRGDGTSPVPLHPHAPARPSSLRLASPVPPLPAERATSPETGADGAFLQDLMVTPLDSLSLSFAHVQTVPGEPFPSASSTESLSGNNPTAEIESSGEIPVSTGEEKICVEALVVRKVVHEEEDGWWGGQDDGWGFTPDQEGEEEEEGEGDGWGF